MSNKLQNVLFFLFDAEKGKWFRVQDIVIGIDSNTVTVSASLKTLVTKKIVQRKQVGERSFLYKLSPAYNEDKDINNVIRDLVGAQ
jgi:predicted transcriptional regulator